MLLLEAQRGGQGGDAPAHDGDRFLNCVSHVHSFGRLELESSPLIAKG
jgi:hypothetical protein